MAMVGVVKEAKERWRESCKRACSSSVCGVASRLSVVGIGRAVTADDVAEAEVRDLLIREGCDGEGEHRTQPVATVAWPGHARAPEEVPHPGAAFDRVGAQAAPRRERAGAESAGE